MKISFRINALVAGAALAFLAVVPSASAYNLTLADPGFSGNGGKILGDLDLNVLDPSPSSITSALGTSGWYGMANAVGVANLGFRGGVEVNQSPLSLGVGLINYDLGSNLTGLLGLDIPDAYLWQPLAGISFEANTTYTFSIDMTTSSLLSANLLADRGFGIGLTHNASTTTPGSFVADSLSSPELLNISLLGGTTQRLTVSFTTGETAPTGDIGVAVFSGRGNQTINASLLGDITVDNAALAVPEPSSAALLVGGLGVLMHWGRRRKACTNTGI
jgi:hypothetical protein